MNIVELAQLSDEELKVQMLNGSISFDDYWQARMEKRRPVYRNLFVSWADQAKGNYSLPEDLKPLCDWAFGRTEKCPL